MNESIPHLRKSKCFIVIFRENLRHYLNKDILKYITSFVCTFLIIRMFLKYMYYVKTKLADGRKCTHKAALLSYISPVT